MGCTARLRFALAVVAILQILPSCTSRPIRDDVGAQPVAIQSTAPVLDHLQSFGYTPDGQGFGLLMDDKTAEKSSVQIFQKVFGLPETGEYDNATQELMSRPRCGNKDTDLVLKARGLARKRKRFVVASVWATKHLTWSFLNISTDPTKNSITKDQLISTVTQAFKLWENSSDLTFSQVPVGGDVTVLMAQGNHTFVTPRFRCVQNFDGSSPPSSSGVISPNILAHGYYPKYGQLHFDGGDKFVIHADVPKTGGIDLLYTSVHEIGHVIGLAHSADPGAIMYPYYGYKANMTLGQDDINGVQNLYGAPNVMATVTKAPPPSLNNWCMKGANIDAIDNPDLSQMQLYIFRGDEFAIIKTVDVPNHFPAKIADYFPALVGGVNASVTLPYMATCYDSKHTTMYPCLQCVTYYFKRGIVLAFDHSASNSPIGTANINDWFKGLPSNYIDSAFIRKDGKMYFTQGTQIYRFTPYVGLDTGFPKPIAKVITGLPTKIDAGLSLGIAVPSGVLYTNMFFAGSGYYTLRDNNTAVDSTTPSPTGLRLLGCATVGMLNQLIQDDNGTGSVSLDSAASQVQEQNILKQLQSQSVDSASGLDTKYDQAGNPFQTNGTVKMAPADGSVVVLANVMPGQIQPTQAKIVSYDKMQLLSSGIKHQIAVQLVVGVFLTMYM